MENHSYDNMLGFMDAPVGDLKGDEFQYLKPHDITSQIYKIQRGSSFQTIPDPPHGFDSVNKQLFGTENYPRNASQIPDNSGFAWVYKTDAGGDPQNIINVYSPDQVPVLSSLAENFKTMNRWFCSIPSCTDPNKMFLHAASSQSVTDNCVGKWYCDYYPIKTKTIFDSIQDEGLSWKSYYMDWCEPMAIEPINQQTEKFIHDQEYKIFFDDLKKGNLPNYTYLVPRFYNTEKGLYPNTQHPSEDIRNGEYLIKQVYENLRASQYWENTLLLITYDEHGGFWDSVPPTQTVPNPYPQNPGQPDIFNFDRLGPRVPTIAISPWLKKAVDSTVYEHASIPATVKEIFNLKADYLNPRDRAANHFIRQEDILPQMRTDLPLKLSDVSPSFEEVPLKPIQDEKRGNVFDQMKVLASVLIKRRIIEPEQYLKIVEFIKTDNHAVQFMKEAMILLGYKLNQEVKFQFLQEMLKK